MTDAYRLHYAPDNASLIIRLALEEIGGPYETVLVDRTANAHKSPAYLRLNPAGLIPVLETPQGPLFETGAILLWLADTHPVSGLAPAPSDPDRGPFLTWLFFVANTLHADLRITFHPGLYAGNNPDAQADLVRNVQLRLRTHLALLDDLAGQNPDWFSPKRASILGFYLACLMRWMALYPRGPDRSWFDLNNTPVLQTLLGACEQRPSAIAASRAEGLGPTPFTAPHYATPPEGSPT